MRIMPRALGLLNTFDRVFIRRQFHSFNSALP
jgi:hypothetical protein